MSAFATRASIASFSAVAAALIAAWLSPASSAMRSRATALAASYFAATSEAVTEAVDGVRLTWDALDGAEGYHIYKKMGSGSYSAKPAAVLEDPLSAEWTDTDIAEVADFSYRIKAWVTDPQTQ